ncbi:dipeptidase [Sphingoaurantiacus capsulatus]|uniref:Dipeptidase n=1 Tax=Sphingoaurantiacus capsulatus TaxID=1771310 RepID=A0ABV7XB87_9SPHN
MILGAAAAAMARPGLAKGDPAWYDRAIIIDALGSVKDPYSPGGTRRLSDRAWLETRATGITMIRDSVFPVGNIADPWGEYLKKIAEHKDELAANPDRLRLVRTTADILSAKRDGRFAVLLGTQDSVMVGPELDRLAQLKADGVMTVQLTYNNRNLAGDGALEPDNAGLSKLGRATIERIEAEKLLLDLSHGGARTMAEGTAHAKRPLVISHTAARALTDHPRNTSDETIRAVAAKGGVVGVYFMPFLTLDSQPTGADLIRHIEHVAKVAGEDHVGIGTDNGQLPPVITEATRKSNREWALERMRRGIAAPGEGPDVFPIVADYNSVDRFQRLAAALARRGWSVTRLEKLFGGNFLRVYREAWGA